MIDFLPITAFAVSFYEIKNRKTNILWKLFECTVEKRIILKTPQSEQNNVINNQDTLQHGCI